MNATIGLLSFLKNFSHELVSLDKDRTFSLWHNLHASSFPPESEILVLFHGILANSVLNYASIGTDLSSADGPIILCDLPGHYIDATSAAGLSWPTPLTPESSAPYFVELLQGYIEATREILSSAGIDLAASELKVGGYSLGGHYAFEFLRQLDTTRDADVPKSQLVLMSSGMYLRSAVPRALLHITAMGPILAWLNSDGVRNFVLAAYGGVSSVEYLQRWLPVSTSAGADLAQIWRSAALSQMLSQYYYHTTEGQAQIADFAAAHLGRVSQLISVWDPFVPGYLQRRSANDLRARVSPVGNGHFQILRNPLVFAPLVNRSLSEPNELSTDCAISER